MEILGYQPFYIQSLGGLRTEIERLGLRIPVDADLSPLAQNLTIGARKISNRFCAQPIAGGDAEATGAPGELTSRRYRRYAAGRFGLIWLESTTAGAPEKAGKLALHDGTVAVFRAVVQELRASADENLVLILQLASENPEGLIHAARHAVDAGFDGIDLQCSREILPDVMARVHASTPGLVLAARLNVYEAVRGGFGVSANDYRKPDLTEPIRFVQQLRSRGLALLNVTAASPILGGPERGTRGRADSEAADEHPLMTLDRQLRLASDFRAALPGLPVVASGFSWLRQYVPQVAAGALREGMMDFVGLGRSALAYPSAPADIMDYGHMDAESTCMVCFACSQLRDDGESVGCVLRDSAIYGPTYRQMRRFDADQLLAGANRCHLCEAAPCIRAAPTRVDIPAFIRAFREGDESRAYEIIRERDALPELTAQFAPGWLESEGACIETTLSGVPVPILDLQYAISWRARDRGQTGVRLPVETTGQSIAIAGGGPTGLAAAIRLLELGHSVDLYEQAGCLGGVPQRLLSVHRRLNPQLEIQAILQPALAAGRLQLHVGATLGKDFALRELRAHHPAVLVATGLWEEHSLGHAQGAIGALAFLESPATAVPDRVAILAGGDTAMDAACAVQSRGAKEIFVIFGGPRSEMHWHMPESWFATPGVHAMMNWQPLGYETDATNDGCGVRLRHLEFHFETVLHVGLVIEAMELHVSDIVRDALAGQTHGIYTAGALLTGGASVGQCVAEGLDVAATIHRDLQIPA